MKIELSDIESVEKNPLELFYEGLKSPATKDRYTRILNHTLCVVFEKVLTGTFEERASELVKNSKINPEWAMNLLLTYSKKLKERTNLPKTDKEYLNPSSFGNFFKPLKKLFDMNGVPVVWKRVYATYPELNNQNSGRGYTRDEIQKFLEFAKGPIDKAIILVASSSGIREGGMNLKWENVLPVYKVDDKLLLEITESQVPKAKVVCGILQIYDGTPEYYPAFITPECYRALMNWKTTWEIEIGRPIRPVDPIFIKEEKGRDGESKRPSKIPIMLKPTAIKQRVTRLLVESGYRIPLQKGKRRHEVPTMNGFRRFHNKTSKETVSEDSALGSLIKKEYMMGHTGLVKLDRNYFQTHVLELVEEYLNVVPHLTISNEERNKIVIKNLKTEKDKALEESEDIRHQFSHRIRKQNRRIEELERKLDELEKKR
ncbi:MAG: integrase [Thaumarchaeota archaeon]|nr:integrase [Nitrososphaerota archaeon]